ncbi:hypothetical protein TBK1r_43560 [Stieleria magnilauensis]|uniref:Uncharacterized protein n=1 Tax=Stieleria magnilauensis TaxID=2527963 RepID=A0ABX5XUA3_9BACT|nr:hypothetical protein TBK1r_43560 [Planctomycetes bacterium TBK1r]
MVHTSSGAVAAKCVSRNSRFLLSLKNRVQCRLLFVREEVAVAAALFFGLMAYPGVNESLVDSLDQR